MSFVVVLPRWLGDGGGTIGEEHQPFPRRQEHSGGVAGPGDLLHGHQGMRLAGGTCPSRMVKHVGLLPKVPGWSGDHVLCSAGPS